MVFYSHISFTFIYLHLCRWHFFSLDYLFLKPYVLILKILTLKWYLVPDSSLKGHQPNGCFFLFHSEVILQLDSSKPQFPPTHTHTLLIPSKWNEAQAGFLWTNLGCRLNILLFSCTSRLIWVLMVFICLFFLGSCISFYHLPHTPLSLSWVSAILSSTILPSAYNLQ